MELSNGSGKDRHCVFCSRKNDSLFDDSKMGSPNYTGTGTTPNHSRTRPGAARRRTPTVGPAWSKVFSRARRLLTQDAPPAACTCVVVPHDQGLVVVATVHGGRSGVAHKLRRTTWCHRAGHPGTLPTYRQGHCNEPSGGISSLHAPSAHRCLRPLWA